MLLKKGPKSSASDELLPLSVALSYALPTVGISFLFAPMAIVQGVYTKYFGLTLGALAALILIARLFDAITDPLVGMLSDRYYSTKYGRKIFVLTGGVLMIVSSYFLFVPVDVSLVESTPGVLPESLFKVSPMYFLGWSVAFYLAWTLFEIPHMAWGSELATDAKSKNKVFSFRAMGVTVGGALFFAIPLLPFFETSEITPDTLRWSVVAASLVLAVVLYFCIAKVPVGHRFQSKSAAQSPDKIMKRLSSFVTIVRCNKPFLIFLGAFFFTGAGIGMWFGLLFIFVDIYLGLGDRLPLVYLVSMAVSILTLGGWYVVANCIGKKMAWGLGMLLIMSGILVSGVLVPNQSWIPLLFCMIAIHIGSLAAAILSPSLLSDIIDYGTWKLGADNAASYFSLYTLLTKSNAAIGGALGLAIAGYYGFDATISAQSEAAVFGLNLAMVWLPALLILLATIFIVSIPINDRRHRIVLRRIYAAESSVLPCHKPLAPEAKIDTTGADGLLMAVKSS